MSYGIMRVQKFKVGSVKGIEIHDNRDKDHSHTNKDIDFEKSKNNFDVHEQNEGTFRQQINKRISELNLERAVRKDAVVMAQVLVTSDKEFFENKSPGQIHKFFEESYEFLKERYGEENIISAKVHMDERTPHMHFNFVPITEGRLSAKRVLTRISLIKQQDKFFEKVGTKWDLKRGERSENKRIHLDVADLKERTSKELDGIRNDLEAYKATYESSMPIKEIKETKLFGAREIKSVEISKSAYDDMRNHWLKKGVGDSSFERTDVKRLMQKNKDLAAENVRLSNKLDKLDKQFRDYKFQVSKDMHRLAKHDRVFKANPDLEKAFKDASKTLVRGFSR